MATTGYPEFYTFGETMAAMIPGSAGPLRYVRDFGMRIAGTESNTAIGLAKLGRSAAWVSRLGNDELGRFVNNSIRAEGVDVSGVVFDPEYRTGVMFKEMSAGETRVYYYRENSAASHMRADDIAPEAVRNARIVHCTGVTPVLSPECGRAVYHAMELAEQYGVSISFDPNVRKKLWRGQDFAPLLKELTLRAHIVLLGLDEAETILGTTIPEEIFDCLLCEGNARAVAIKNGSEGAWVADADTRRHIDPFSCRPVEPIGAGDAFNAGFLAGLLEEADIETCGRMGAIAGALATEVPGDIEGYPSSEKMHSLLNHAKEVYR